MKMKSVVVSFVTTVFVLTAANTELEQADDGHCIWYGECKDTPSGKLNCVYNGPAKPLVDPKALHTLQHFCPDLYAGNDTKTCCNPDQLLSFERNSGLIEQFLMSCPSCFFNFMNIFCYLTCDPHQSQSVGVKNQVPNEKGAPAVSAVDYAMSSEFAYGMFNSCQNVKLPSAKGLVLDVICGRPASQCTPQNLLAYLGSSSNGRTPFDIVFHVQDTPWEKKGSYSLQPMNVSVVPCCEKYRNFSACSPLDCLGILVPLTPSLPNISHIYPWPSYRVEQLIVSRPNNKTLVSHNMPPPSLSKVNYSSLFDKTFMHMLLDLQLQVQNITADYDGKIVTLEDICYRGNNSKTCVILSVFQYYQSSHSNIDKTAWDDYHFFQEADYLDHFQACVNKPNSTSDLTKLNMSCVSSGGYPIDPWLVTKDDNGTYYRDSKFFVISFIVKNHQSKEENEAAEAWENEFVRFMENFHSPNMTVKFSTKIPSSDSTNGKFHNPVVDIWGTGAPHTGDSAAMAPRSLSVALLISFGLAVLYIFKLW